MHDPDKSVLIVEDDADVRESLVAILESEGYRVLEAENGAVALDQLRRDVPVCLILLDLFMPTMNGWTFRDEQLRDPQLAPIPVIVISADAAAAGGRRRSASSVRSRSRWISTGCWRS